MNEQQPCLFSPAATREKDSKRDGRKSRRGTSPRSHLGILLVDESLEHLPAAVEHPTIEAFAAYLREHLHFNSAKTRARDANYIARRYSREGKVNLALARFLKLCPDDRSRREVLWFETVRATPLLKELTESWLSKTGETGTTRKELIAFLQPRVGNRKPEKIAKEAILGLKKYGHLTNPKPGYYVAVWAEPPLDAFAYALSQLYPTPTAVRMEVLKMEPLWQALLWPPAALERLILQNERSGEIGSVTQLDNYYQFSLSGTDEERLGRLFAKWSQCETYKNER